MDENGLPITGAGVNYAAVEAINQRELVTYLNMFLVRTCSFLNNFSTKCESKLSMLHSRLESIETSITLLETKLDSVEELKNLKLDETSTTTTDQQQTTTAVSTGSVPPPPPPPSLTSSSSIVPPESNAVANADMPPPPPPQPPSNPICQDPRYIKYFKMLKMGVAEEAVRIKMRTENVDPSFLDRPDDPAPPPDPVDSAENSDDENSD